MINGDRITGSIKRVWDGELVIEPDYGDEVAIELAAITTIDAEEPFEIELRDHEEIVGRLAVGAQGEPLLITDSGIERFPPTSIEELNEIESFFDWDVKADVSFNANSGNTETTDLVGQITGMTKLGDHRHEVFLSVRRSSTDGATTREQDNGRYEYSWFFNDPWFLQAGVGYERDPIRDLTYRYLPGGGIGYQFFDDSYRRLEVALAAVAVIEKIGGTEEDSIAPIWTLDYRRKMLSGDLEFFHRHSLITYVSGRDNDVINTSTGIRWDVWGDVYMNLQIDYDWESNPIGNNQKSDTTYLLGVGVALD